MIWVPNVIRVVGYFHRRTKNTKSETFVLSVEGCSKLEVVIVNNLVRFSIVVFFLSSASFNFVAAQDGSGAGASESLENYVIREFGVVPRDSSVNLMFCMADQFDGRWHLNATRGSITGTRDNISTCVWAVNGGNIGRNFSLDLTLTSGGSECCLTGFSEGTVDRPSRTATGTTTWGSNCSGTFDYQWHAPC